MPTAFADLTAEQKAELGASLAALPEAERLKEMRLLADKIKDDEIARCAKDGWYFVKHLVKTRDEAAGAEHSIMPFPDEPALKAIWNVLEHSPSKLIIIAKSRQIMVSWVTCAFALWRARFFPNRQVVWQTKKEDDAKDMVCYGQDRLDEARMQFIESHLPHFMAKKRRFRDGQIIYDNGSKIVAVPEGGHQVRSKTTSLIVIDEAAFQDQFQAALTAALPLLNKESKMIAISTPNGKNAFYEAYMKGQASGNVIYSQQGITIWENPATSITSIRIHYSAFPDKDPNHPNPEKAAGANAWIDSMRPAYPGDTWMPEMEISFTHTKGSRVYPVFREDVHVLDPIKCEQYAAPPTPIRRKKLIRSWDFGWHHPAVLIGQVDLRDRLILYGELQGSDVDIERFTQQVLNYCAREFGDWSAVGYDDYCDPAGAQVRSIMSEKNENTEIQVLARYGIHPGFAPKSRRTGRGILLRMMEMRDDGSPGLLVSRKCPIVIDGMLGGYVYKPKPDGVTFHEEPDDEGYYSHTQACLRYIATNRFSNLAEVFQAHRPRERQVLFGSNSRGGY